MPYRGERGGAKERLASLHEERRGIDAEIARIERALAAVRREGWRRVILAVVCTLCWIGLALSLPFVVVPLPGLLHRRSHPGRVESTLGDAQSLRSAAVMYVFENPGKPCPGPKVLSSGGYSDSSRRNEDAWGQAFRIRCAGDDVLVTSAGPDGVFDTADDVE